tara:strand:- start:348 stop:737 length:390 start_codon:yes stop_codon:yes gene_type:complete
MQTYEINLWQEKRIIEKIVKEFENDDAVLQYIGDNYDKEDELPRLDQEKGFLRPKQRDIIITWSKISTYVRKKGPKQLVLDDREKELKDTLEKSITQEVINEWGYNEMLRHTKKAYGPNPNAKGFNDRK